MSLYGGGIGEGTGDAVFSERIRIGRGGFASVDSAWHGGLRRRVAVKTFDRDLTADGVTEAYARELSLALRVGCHPRVVRVLDHGVGADGRPWIAMELFDRGSVARLLSDSGPLPVERALHITVVVADTVAWAHSLTPPVLHRDLKAGNVLVDRDGEPHLSDFGSARVYDRGTFTTNGVFTPEHAAPEVLLTARFSVQAEVWSLTSMLFEMLTGAPALAMRSGEGMGQFVMRVAGSGLTPDLVPDDVPPELAGLLLDGMALNREDRIPDVATLAARLRAVQRSLDLPVVAPIAAPNPAEVLPAAALTVPAGPFLRRATAETQDAFPAVHLSWPPPSVTMERPRGSRPRMRALVMTAVTALLLGGVVAAVSIHPGRLRAQNGATGPSSGESTGVPAASTPPKQQPTAASSAPPTGPPAPTSPSTTSIPTSGITTSAAQNQSPASLPSTGGRIPGTSAPASSKAPVQQQQPTTAAAATTPPPVVTTTAPAPPQTWTEESGTHGSPTFTDPVNASGPGSTVPAMSYVQVTCRVYAPQISSSNPDGYWYKIASSPWSNSYYACANTFWNGDIPGQKPYTHNTDFNVPLC